MQKHPNNLNNFYLKDTNLNVIHYDISSPSSQIKLIKFQQDHGHQPKLKNTFNPKMRMNSHSPTGEYEDMFSMDMNDTSLM